MKKLKLELNNNILDQTRAIIYNSDLFLSSPLVNEDYWLYRVKLVKDQAIVGFPKFGLLGVGFAIEEEYWNTNLPINCIEVEGVEKIWNHIKCNKKYPSITKKMGIEAIELIYKGYKRFGNISTIVDKIKNGSIKIPEAQSYHHLLNILKDEINNRDKKKNNL